MNLIIDLSQQPCLILKQGRKEIDRQSWTGLFKLSQTLVLEIDKFLKKNKLTLKALDQIKVIDSPESVVSSRIARATALGLKVERD